MIIDRKKLLFQERIQVSFVDPPARRSPNLSQLLKAGERWAARLSVKTYIEVVFGGVAKKCGWLPNEIHVREKSMFFESYLFYGV